MHLTAARLGWTRWPGGSSTIWIHAVSVGEVQAAGALIAAIEKHSSEKLSVVLTVTTRTGMEVAKRMLAKHPGVAGPLPFPLDLPWAVARRLREIRPKAIVFIDTEIWPNLIRHAGDQGVQLFLANGRISDRSFPRYRFVSPYIRSLLRGFSAFWMQSEQDAVRIQQIGAPAERVRVAGNLKIDALTMGLQPPGSAAARPRGGENEIPLLLAASTHAGEEEIILSAAKTWRDQGKTFKLAIAPRHPERSGEVESLCRRGGYSCVRWSAARSAGTSAAVPVDFPAILLIDTIGDLFSFFPLARLVFVGGSFSNDGGHNIFEPAWFGKPSIYGPHMENFREADKALTGRGGFRVATAADFSQAAAELLFDASNAEEAGRTARATVESLRGASDRIAAELIHSITHVQAAA